MTIKGIFTFCLVLLFSLKSYSQTISEENKAPKRNELNIDLTEPILRQGLSFSYERFLNANSGLGLELFANLRNKSSFNDEYLDFFDSNRTLMLTVYYRRYLSKKKFAKCFFVEGFTALNQANEVEETFSGETEVERTDNLRTDLALGASIGIKFKLADNLTGELYYGAGQNLLGNRDFEVVLRSGISLGFRF